MVQHSQQRFSRVAEHIALADHLLTMTYPLVKDPKLLVGVLQTLARAHEQMIDEVLHKESMQRKIIPTTAFATRFAQFKAILQKQDLFKQSHINTVQMIHDLHREHKRSPVEFSRGQKFVICDDDYSFRTLTPQQLKTHLQHTKDMLVSLQTKEKF